MHDAGAEAQQGVGIGGDHEHAVDRQGAARVVGHALDQTGTEVEGRELLRPLRDLGPARDTFATVPPVVLGDLAMDPYDPLPFHLTHAHLDRLPGETIDELIAQIGPDSGRGPTVTMRHLGGALGPRSRATSA